MTQAIHKMNLSIRSCLLFCFESIIMMWQKWSMNEQQTSERLCLNDNNHLFFPRVYVQRSCTLFLSFALLNAI